MKKITVLLWIIFILDSLVAQQATCFRIALTDKNQNAFSIDRPYEFLSERAVQKRLRLGIPVTEQDLPITTAYKQQILNVNSSIRILTESKWQNTIVVYCPDTNLLNDIMDLPFTVSIVPVANYDLSSRQGGYEEVDMQFVSGSVAVDETNLPYDYGNSFSQVSLFNGHLMHQEGFRGDSMLIVVLDAGWAGMNVHPAFSQLFDNGQIIGTRDLSPFSNNVFTRHSHGTKVTALMACSVEMQLIGTAPHANYYLIRTEEPDSEQPIELDFWAQGAEIADSLGADVLTSSLGYSRFDDFPQGNLTYGQCDGVSNVASLNASIASHKGIVTCVSAGNDGSTDWHYLSVPSDAVDALCVGAVDIDTLVAPFSSRGPSADNRVKPDVVAVGWGTYTVDDNGGFAYGNGTSFSCPLLAGMAACLWQSLPQTSALDIIRIIRKSGHQYSGPDDEMGYGVPDFYQAYLNNKDVENIKINGKSFSLSLFPNPCSDYVYISNENSDIQHIKMYDLSGKCLYDSAVSNASLLMIPTSHLSSGLYIVEAQGEKNISYAKISVR